MKTFVALLFFSMVFGCESDEQYHTRILSGRLKWVYKEWQKDGHPSNFEPTNYLYNVGTTNQYYIFTKPLFANGVLYHCRFAIRDPNRFRRSGILAITDEGAILWVGDDGKINVAQDTKDWSSK